MKNILSKLYIFIIVGLLSFFLFSNLNYVHAENINIEEFEIENTLNIYSLNKTNIENNINISINEEKGYWEQGLDDMKSAETNNQIGKVVVDSLFLMFDDSKKVDPAVVTAEALMSVINVVASCYGLGGITEGIFNGIKNWGLEAEDPIADLKNQINDNFEKTYDELNDIKQMQMYLSEQITNLNKEIMKELKYANNAQDAGNKVKDFFNSSSGNFSYEQFKEYLYGDSANSNEAYFDKITKSTQNDYSDSKKDLDNLYRVLESEYIYAGDSNIDMLYSYILGNENSGEESIQRYYYDYLKANEEFLNGRNAQQVALDFMLDLCKTAVKADDYIKKAISYQKGYLEITQKSEYTYGLGNYDKITYDELLICEKEIEHRQNKLANRIIQDIFYILNFSDSYVLEDLNNNYYTVSDSKSDGFGVVKYGHTIHLNQIPDLLCEKFDINPNKIKYALYGGNTFMGYINESFSVNKLYDNYTVIVTYDDIQLSKFNFYVSDTINDRFYGGTGHKENPYLIGNINQLEIINSDIKYLKNDVYYKLIYDLNYVNTTYEMIGEFEDSTKFFNGTIDGNNYEISNVIIENYEYAALIPHNRGTIKNLNIKTSKFKVLNNKKQNSFVGPISAYNEGKIENCHIYNCEIISETNDDNNLKNKSINTFVGGIAGKSVSSIFMNNGTIKYCSVNNSNFDVKSYKNYNDGKSESNINNITIGGICGTIQGNGELGYISDCYIDGNSDFKAYGNSKGHDFWYYLYPYINIEVAGIVPNTRNNNQINNVLSDLTENNFNCSYDIKNTAAGNYHGDNNCYIKSDPYVLSLKNKDDIISKDDKINFDYNKFDLSYSFETINDKGIATTNYNYEYDCYEEQIYKCNDPKIILDKFKLKINNKNVTYNIISIYNFDTTNESKEKIETKEVDLIVGFNYNNEYYIRKITLKLIVLPNSPDHLVVNSSINTQFTINTTLDQINFNSNSILLYYQNGLFEDVSNKVTVECETIGQYGLNIIKIKYLDFTVETYILFSCVHNYTELETIAPTCKDYGYTLNKCSLCSHKKKNNYLSPLEHKFELINYEKEECYKTGYSGDLVCINCGEIQEEGHAVEKAPHTWINNENGNHICTNPNCMHEEIHYIYSYDYINEENLVGRMYNCHYCNYAYFEEYLYDESIPRIVLSDSFALVEDNKAIVYLKIFENQGLSGLKISLIYDNSLKICEEETMNGNIFSTISPAYGKGIASFTFSNDGLVSNSNGMLLKLTFELPLDKNINDIFEINIVTPLEEDFIDGYANPIKLITMDGTIKIEDHLPADVNNDNNVDILDVVLIHQYISIKANADINNDYTKLNTFIESNSFNTTYADVDLDKKITMIDLITIMQSIIGINSDEILSRNFDIIINTNDGNTLFDKVNVDLYDENTKSYEEILNDYRPYRDGYKFLGWSKDLSTDDVHFIDMSTNNKVTYNKNQKKQIVYAIWERNEIIFNLNNGHNQNNNNIINNVYYIDKSIIDLPMDMSKEINVFLENSTNQDITTFDNENPLIIKYKFLGWSTKNNPDLIIYDINNSTINIKDGEIGKLELFAKYEQINSIQDGKFTGYEFINWSYDDENKLIVDNTQLDETKIIIENNDNCIYLYNKLSIINFTINYINLINGVEIVEEDDSVIRNINNMGELNKPNSFKNTGHYLNGWKLNSLSNEYINKLNTSIFDLLNEDKELNLYTNWEANTYTIKYHSSEGNGIMFNTTYTYGGNSKLTNNDYSKIGNTFNGWSLSEGNSLGEFSNQCSVKEVIDIYSNNHDGLEVNLYACWKRNTYTISYDSNGGSIVNNGEPHTYLYDYPTTEKVDIPTKTDHIFIGWQCTNNFQIGNKMPNYNITATAIWLRVSNTIILSPSTGRNDFEVNDDNYKSETIYPLFDRKSLKTYHYTKIYIKIKFDLYEINDGYQICNVYSHEDKHLITYEYESGGGQTFNAGYKKWETTSFEFEVDINNVQTDGSFWIQWSARGGLDDKWKVGTTILTVEARK